ncbi:lysozyme-like [Schistocerca nitens]|uniref:lysozyme-like n=1 Tax=Schistocerca nitens TaxID=7011 RepID=UPI002118E76C|nr:lysozyme-like [Schistocerca nitens]
MEPSQSQPLPLLLLYLAVTCASAAAAEGAESRLQYDSCYGCICEAASRCNRSLGCDDGACGLFRITRHYWLDAGAPTLPADARLLNDAFERCATDPFCALRTAHHYMERYRKDCNGNQQVDCHDLALLHFLGPSCEGTMPSAYTDEFDNCRFNALLLGAGDI